jgi:DNA processing protein
MLGGENQLEFGSDSKILRTGHFLSFLCSLRGIGPSKALKIASEALTLEGVGEYLQIKKFRPMFESWSRAIAETYAHCALIGYFDDDYPPQLKRLKSPPAALWIWGTLPKGLKGIGIVGTRKPSEAGIACAKVVSSQPDPLQDCVISGLAEGVDLVAHRESLGVGIRNVAVLGEGFAALDGTARGELAKQIVAQGGAIVSEYQPNMQASQGSFVERDRLIAGLSDVLVVVECGIPSGTLHTVSSAIHLGIPVLVADIESATTDTRGNQLLLGAEGLEMSRTDSAWLSRLGLQSPEGINVARFRSRNEFVNLLRK